MLHFAVRVVTLCVNVTFCVDCYILRRNKGSLSSEIPCLLLESPAVWHVKFAYRMNMTIPISLRFSPPTNITGRTIPIYRSDFYRPTLLPESHRKFRNAESSQGHAVSSSRRCGSRCATHRPTERSHCGSVVSVVAELQKGYAIWINMNAKTVEQDEKHTVQRSKLEPMVTVTSV